MFSVVPVWAAIGGAVGEVTPAEAFPFVACHGEQDMYFHKPIVPSGPAVASAAPIGIHVKQSGTTVVSRIKTHDEAGELVNEQYSVTFFRGVTGGEGKGKTAEHRFPEELRSSDPAAVAADQTFDLDQTYRYSATSSNKVPIHLDEEFAKSVGLPGIIIHGLCTMAFTSWAAIGKLYAAGEPKLLKRLAVRFSKPVLPGETMTTRFWTAGERDGNTVYTFESTNPAGDAVIKDGVAEIAI